MANSNDALAHHWYAEHLITIGQVDRGIAELERARKLDPLSLPINATLGRAYRDARRYEQAVDQCRKTLDLDPDFPLARWCLGVSYVAIKHYAEAVIEMQRASAVGASPLYMSGLGYAYAAAGNRVKAKAVIDVLKQGADRTYMPAYFIASIYGELGERERAFEWLQRGYDERDPQVAYLLVDPFMDPLRSDPRFNTLVRKFGFPQ
jgi:tetratricopeptide (TPR) repeat protein